MPSINNDLIKILHNVQRPGDFYATGTAEIFAPRLEIEGVGRVALPLLPAQAEQIVAAAERAPYGRGEETVVDIEVRRTWQVDAGRVVISGKHWQSDLDALVEQVVTALGVRGKVKAELYKLLVYDEGSFFVHHRDTEKAAGMFATLVIVLPSNYSGGELVVRHQDREVMLDLCREDPAEIAFAAFYADCVHEVRPVTSGCRLTLVYNLLRPAKQAALPKPPDYRDEQTQVAALLRNWADGLSTEADDGAPEKLLYLLEHAYTPAELGFDTLKNADAAVAEVLVAAAEQADCEIYLALVAIEESGGAEHTYYGGRGRRRYWDDEDDEDDDFEIVEVYDRSETVSEWRRPDGSRPTLAALPFSEDELCPPNAFKDMEPDDVKFHEATGNEGASFDRTYSRAAMVIWPRARRLAILNQAGLDTTLPLLGELCQRWEAEGRDFDAPLWRDAHALAAYMLRDWPSTYGRGRSIKKPESSACEFLGYLYRLRDSERIDAFWAAVVQTGFRDKEDSAALVQAAELLPWPRVVALLENLMNSSAEVAAGACAALLARLSAAGQGDASELSRAAQTLLDVLPGDPARPSQLEPWERSKVDVGLVIDLMTALSAIDTALAERALQYLLSYPGTYDMDTVLVPAGVRLSELPASHSLPAVERLRATVQAHLGARVGEVLEPPADWQRDSQISCNCAYCTELSGFLADPGQAKWRFKGAEAKRQHVEHSIWRDHCEVDCTTDRSSRPYILVCTKNQARYERRVAQRKQDLDNLARLEAQ